MRTLLLKSATPPQEFPIGKGLTIGKSSENSIKLTEGKVEERHAKVVAVGAHLFIEDLDSREGVLVNGKKAARWALKPGDVIQIGGSELVYAEDSRPEPAPSTAPSKSSAANPATSPKVSQAASSSSARNPKTSSHPSTGLKGSGSGSSVVKAAAASAVSSPSRPAITPSAPKPAASSSQRTPDPAHSTASKSSSSASSTRTAHTSSASLELRSSSRAPVAHQNVSTLLRVALGGFVLLVLLIGVFIGWPYLTAWREETANARNASKEETEALARLLQPGLKDLKDLELIKGKLNRAKNWDAIERLLGKPDLQAQDKFKTWISGTGTEDLEGHSFKAYYLSNPTFPDPTIGDIAFVFLFKVDVDGALTCLNTRYHARREFSNLSQSKAIPQKAIGALEMEGSPPVSEQKAKFLDPNVKLGLDGRPVDPSQKPYMPDIPRAPNGQPLEASLIGHDPEVPKPAMQPVQPGPK